MKETRQEGAQKKGWALHYAMEKRRRLQLTRQRTTRGEKRSILLRASLSLSPCLTIFSVLLMICTRRECVQESDVAARK